MNKPAQLLIVSAFGLLAMLLSIPVAAQADDGRVPFTPPSIVPSKGAFQPDGSQLRDRVIEGRIPALARLQVAPASSYPDGDGHFVSIRVSDYYSPDATADQALATYLGTLLHGSEMSLLHVTVLGPTEMEGVCGGTAAACYFPGQNKMAIVGESEFGGLPTNFVVAHEYGHHIATHRKNTPWRAVDYGPKRWATYEGICLNTARGVYFPGNEGKHYWENPGEAFAESYAKYDARYRTFPWEWTAGLEPDDTAYEAIRQDVSEPWKGNTVSRYSGQVSRGRSATVPFDASLDGGMSIKLTGSAGTDFDLTLLTKNGRVLQRSAHAGSRETIRYAVCGQPKLKLRVSSYQGSGTARVTLSKP